MQAVKTIHPADSKAELARQTQQLRRNLETPISAPRIALERKISLRFPHFQGFLTEYCSNISITGMFIQSREPRSPGEILDFEFNLIDGLQLIRGTGEVMWSRLTDEGTDLLAGMGIRFLRLDAESRRLIRWAVEKQISAGGKPFDLDAYRSEALEVSDAEAQESADQLADPSQSATRQSKLTGMAIVDAQRRHPYAGYAMARHIDWRARLLAAATVSLPVVILATAVLISYPRSQSVAFATGPLSAETTSAPAAGLPEASAPGEPAGSEATPAAPAQTTGLESELVASTLEWAQAWAGQRPEDYLHHYSQRFRPPRSMSRNVWEAQRTDRISTPDFIQVDVSSLETEMLAPDRARVTFDQAYRSDDFRDTMRKTLELVREDGAWKILEERAATG